MSINFIKIENTRGKIIGVIAVERGSDEEAMIVDSFLDRKLPFSKATESEYAAFDGEVVKHTKNAIYCHLLPK